MVTCGDHLGFSRLLPARRDMIFHSTGNQSAPHQSLISKRVRRLKNSARRDLSSSGTSPEKSARTTGQGLLLLCMLMPRTGCHWITGRDPLVGLFYLIFLNVL